MKRVVILTGGAILLLASAAGYTAADTGSISPPHAITSDQVTCTEDANGKLNCVLPPLPTPKE